MQGREKERVMRAEELEKNRPMRKEECEAHEGMELEKLELMLESQRTSGSKIKDRELHIGLSFNPCE